MLHSLFFDGTMFEETVQRFAGSHLCIAPDHRGQGASSMGQNAPTMAQLATDIILLLDQLALPRVHLVGSSMGGYVALEIMREHADRVASLTLSCCTGQSEANPERFAALADSFSEPRHPDLPANLVAIMFGRSFVNNQSATFDYWQRKFKQLPNHTEEVVRRVFEHADFRSVLTQINCPTLLIAGAEDRAKRPEDLLWIQQQIPVSADYAVIDDAGHTPAVETPQHYAGLINNFIHRAETATTQHHCV